MKPLRLLAVGVAVTATVATATPAGHAAPDHLDHSRTTAEMRAAHGVGMAPAGAATPAARTSVSRAASPRAYGGVALQPCPGDDAWLACGTVKVPLNRADPHDTRTIGIHVELSVHSAAGARRGVIVIEAGGPGTAISQTKYGYFDSLLGDLPETFDIVLIDQRGVGKSEAIDCEALEQAVTTKERYDAAAACHRSLGDRARLFSTRAVADDIDSVRGALGVDKINLFGNSYAGNDVVTYAVRHRTHVRSVVTTSAELTPGEDTFWGSIPRSLPRITGTLCARSASCSAAVASPTSDLTWLASTLRHNPLQGTYVDGEGTTHDVLLTEAKLLNWLLPNPGYEWAGPGEISQAARAYRSGDSAALLRLAGQNDLEPSPAGFDPAFFSTGHNLARRCVDEPFPWTKSASLQQRSAQYARARAAQPDFYGPFAKDAWLRPDTAGVAQSLPQPDPCIANSWPDVPAYRAGSTVPHVPALVMSGEYDSVVPTPDARRVTEVLTDSTFAQIPAAFHNVWGWSGCPSELVGMFYRTLRAHSTCTRQPEYPKWFPGSFARTSTQLPPATLRSGAATPAVRRATTSAVWATLDSIRHSFDNPFDTQPGLRGGTERYQGFDEDAQADVFGFEGVRFTDDVAVSGSLHWSVADNALDGDLTVTTPSGAARVHLHGVWLAPGADRLTLTGGQGVVLTVPAT